MIQKPDSVIYRHLLVVLAFYLEYDKKKKKKKKTLKV